MLDKINVLREMLDEQVQNNESYDLILKTSQEIDKLLVEFYKSQELVKGMRDLTLVK